MGDIIFYGREVGKIMCGVDGPFLNPKGVPVRDPEVVCGRPSVRYCATRSDALKISQTSKIRGGESDHRKSGGWSKRRGEDPLTHTKQGSPVPEEGVGVAWDLLRWEADARRRPDGGPTGHTHTHTHTHTNTRLVELFLVPVW